jgi:hypothetical protein
MDNLLETLSESERQIVCECLRAAENEDIFPEWEFETLFGVDRKILKSVRLAWPDVDASDPEVRLVIANSMSHLLGYPWTSDKRWETHLSIGAVEVRAVLEKLLAIGL